VRRDEKTIYPQMNTVFKKGDKVLLFTHTVNPAKLSRLFGQSTPLEL